MFMQERNLCLKFDNATTVKATSAARKSTRINKMADNNTIHNGMP